jgi:hypothetical protein
MPTKLLDIRGGDALVANLPVPRVGGSAAFTRASVATQINSGVLVPVATGLVRVSDFIDPVSGLAVPTLLIEQQLTNDYLHTQIESGWTKSDSTSGITQSAATGPDNVANSAVKLVEGTTASAIYVISQFVTYEVAGVQSNHIFLKAAERGWAIIRTMRYDNSFKYSWIDLTNGVVGTKDASHTIRIRAMTSGWYRVTVFWDAVGSGGFNANFAFGPCDADNHQTYTGNGSSGIYAYGADWRKNFSNHDTMSVIPATSAALTKIGDFLQFGYTSAPQQATYFVEFYEETPSTGGTNQRVVTFGDSSGSGGPSLRIWRVSGAYQAIWHNGTDSVTATTGALTYVTGDRIRLRIIHNTDGSVQIGAKINSAAEVLGSATAAKTIGSTWNQLKVTLGADYNAGNKGNQGFVSVQAATGVLTAFPDVATRSTYGTRRGVRQAA